MSRGGAEREGDTEREAGSRLRAVSTEPDAGCKVQDCSKVQDFWSVAEESTDQTLTVGEARSLVALAAILGQEAIQSEKEAGAWRRGER